MKALLFMKKNKPCAEKVISYIKNKFDDSDVFWGDMGNEFPSLKDNIEQDVLISYISPWIIPEEILKRTKMYNINFHPGPPEYPGIGCVNFALYNNEKEYGVTAHIMEKKVDAGKIIAVKRFAISQDDSIQTVLDRSYEKLFEIFTEVLDSVIDNGELPECDEIWTREPFRRVELEKLCRIEPGMDSSEIENRLRATSYPGKPGAYIEVNGYKFTYDPDR